MNEGQLQGRSHSGALTLRGMTSRTRSLIADLRAIREQQDDAPSGESWAQRFEDYAADRARVHVYLEEFWSVEDELEATIKRDGWPIGPRE